MKVKNDKLEIVFYSDDFLDQHKNKFIIEMYPYTVHSFKIKWFTHKFFITDYTQNEKDDVHSVIGKSIK